MTRQSSLPRYRILCGAALALSFALGIRAAGADAQNSASQAQTFGTQGLRLTIPPAVNSPIELTTIPDAECTLHPVGDAAHRIHVYADQAGTIRFFVRPGSASEQLTHLVADCVAGAKSATYAVDLRAASQATAEMPAYRRAAAQPVAGRKLLALDKTEAAQLSDAELTQRGYPLRPDAAGAPKAYQAWLRAVTAPIFSISAQTRLSSEAREDYCHCYRPYPPIKFRPPSVNRVLPALTKAQALALSDAELKARGYPPRPAGGRLTAALAAWITKVSVPISTLLPSNSPEGSNIWSGDELQEKAGAYDWVTGAWNVVSVTGEANTNTDSSTWIGIDGDGTTDLVQAGTEQEAFGTGNTLVTTYRAWTEFLPQQATESIITNFNVSPGDQIFVEVSMGSPGGSLSLNGPFGVFWVMNMTTGTTTEIFTPIGSTSVGGSEAEWIMERPTFGTTPADLADYGTGSIYWAYARRPNSARHQGYVTCCNGSTSVNITMSNNANGNTLSTDATPDSQTVDFTWKAFK
jgi:hypothetical protein